MSSCRENKASKGCVDRSRIIGEGSFKRVYKGTYVEGTRKGRPQATKELIQGTPYTSKVFHYDTAVAIRASEIVEMWNASKLIDKKILISIPEVWVYSGDSRLAGMTHLVEPFIENFEKFNSNTGWVPAHPKRWTQLMQALSHFSYHISRRSVLLCDLQGAIYSKCAVLTDPAIHSSDRRFGPTDMGKKGMSTFFHRHTCNQFCRPEWRRPPVTAEEFPVRYGTSMVRADGVWLMPSRETRPNLPSEHSVDEAPADGRSHACPQSPRRSAASTGASGGGGSSRFHKLWRWPLGCQGWPLGCRGTADRVSLSAASHGMSGGRHQEHTLGPAGGPAQPSRCGTQVSACAQSACMSTGATSGGGVGTVCTL